MIQVPVLFTKKEMCCGCAACCNICPMSAIAMEEDEEGFEFPVIHREKCVDCGRCVRVCPIDAILEKGNL